MIAESPALILEVNLWGSPTSSFAPQSQRLKAQGLVISQQKIQSSNQQDIDEKEQ